MSVLSITFHTPTNLLEAWETYVNNELHQMAENLMDVEKYVLSEVYSEMISEGKNTNLLLIFENDEKREDFLGIEMQNITERIENQFGQEVMVFQTLLNPIQTRL